MITNNRVTLVPLELSDGSIIQIEAISIGEEDVSWQTFPFKDVLSKIKSIAYDFSETIQEIKEESKPDKVSLTLGLEVAIESGQLVNAIAKGTATANIEVTLEWGK